MNVSSYLEAFLSVYGWAVYRTMFLLFMMTGLFLYPILRSLIGLLIDFLSSGRNDATGYLKQAGGVVALSIAVFFFAMAPVVDMSFSKARVENICEVKRGTVEEVNNASKKNNAGKYFSITETRVPILPWIAMRLAQGLNSIFYTSMPCVMHTADANRVAMNLETGDEKLDKEFNEFMNQCHNKAVNIIREIRRGAYDTSAAGEGQKDAKNGEVQKWFNQEVVKAANDKFKSLGRYTNADQLKPNESIELLEFVDSEFIAKYIYAKYDNPIYSAPDNVREALQTIPDSMRATSPVEGFSGKNGDGLPTCETWWNRGEGATKGLRQRLLASLEDDAVIKAAARSQIPECNYKTEEVEGYLGAKGIRTTNELENKTACLEKFREVLTSRESREKGTAANIAGRNILLSHQGNHAHIKDDTINSGESTNAFLLAAGAIAAGAISTYFGVDLSGGLIGTVVSFYGTIFVMKMMLKFLLPMAIMAVYMFWGIYMLIGEMRGATIVKGMVLIFSLTIIPGLWSVADHLDDKLWDAMYDSWTDGPIQMVLLDAASGIFYLAIPMIVFYLINLAGAGDHSGALADVQNNAKGLSGNVGQATGKGTNKSFNWFVKGDRNSKGEIKSGGFVTKFGSGIKGGWNKWRGKNQ